MRRLTFIGLLLVLVTGLALGCGEATTTTTHDRLTDPTYPNTITTETTWTTLDASEMALVEPYAPFLRAMAHGLADAAYEENGDLPFEMGGLGASAVYDDEAQAVVLDMAARFSDYVKFCDVYDERAWQITQAVAAFYIDDEYVGLLEGNPLPSLRLSVDGIMYEVTAAVLTGIARSEVTKEEWLRATGR